MKNIQIDIFKKLIPQQKFLDLNIKIPPRGGILL